MSADTSADLAAYVPGPTTLPGGAGAPSWEGELTRRDYAAWSRHAARRGMGLATNVVVAGGALAGMGAAWLAASRGEPLIAGLVALGVVLTGAVYPQLVGRMMQYDAGPTRMWFDDTGVRVVTRTVTTSFAWPRVQRVSRTPHHAFLQIAPAVAVIVPLRGFCSDAERDRFEALLTRQGHGGAERQVAVDELLDRSGSR